MVWGRVGGGMIHLNFRPLGFDTLLCPSHGSFVINLVRLEKPHKVLL